VLAVAAGVMLAKLRFLHKWIAGAVLALGSAALILTFSRGGWMALAVAIAVICYAAWRQGRSSLKVPLAILAILALAYLPFRTLVSARMFGDDNGSAESRIPLNNLALRMIEDHPVLGIGPNNFTVAMPQYLTSEFRREFLYTVHNTYLLIWTETGIAGLLAYLAFLIGTLRTGWRCWKLRDSLLSPLALAFAAGIAGHMLHQGVDIFADRPIQQLLWLAAGLLVAMQGMCKEDRDPRLVSSLA